MIDHIPWPNESPLTGINGQNIALLGYSHHRKFEEADTNEFTRDVIAAVVNGHKHRSLNALRSIAGYFCSLGYARKETFWNQVTFFNYLPECIGPSDARFRDGTPEQVERAKPRLLRILRNVEAQKVLIFTSRSWQLPQTREQQEGRSNIPLGQEFPNFWWGTYDVGDGRSVRVFKLRHPQGASSDVMRRAVQCIMDETFAGSCSVRP